MPSIPIRKLKNVVESVAAIKPLPAALLDGLWLVVDCGPGQQTRVEKGREGEKLRRDGTQVYEQRYLVDEEKPSESREYGKL